MSALMTGTQPVIYGDGEHSRDFTYIANVIDANLRAAESAAAVGEIMNIANGHRTTLNELLDVMKAVTGKSRRNCPTRSASRR
jgi:nucleoside-diphosphate-sugar epimerase